MPSDKKYPYSNTQIQMSTEATSEFLKRSKYVISTSDLYSDDTGFEDNPHITILYGIHSENPSIELIDIIETHPKFTVTLGDISLFKGNEHGNAFDVIKAEVDCSDCYALNSIFREICEYTTEYPTYIPHATVAYVEKGTNDHLDGLGTFNGLSFIANSIIFSGKNGIDRNIFLGLR